MSTREIVNTNKAPSAIGPYSQAVKTGDLVFISGQIPLDPATMEIVSEDIEAVRYLPICMPWLKLPARAWTMRSS